MKKQPSVTYVGPLVAPVFKMKERPLLSKLVSSTGISKLHEKRLPPLTKRHGKFDLFRDTMANISACRAMKIDISNGSYVIYKNIPDIVSAPRELPGSTNILTSVFLQSYNLKRFKSDVCRGEYNSKEVCNSGHINTKDKANIALKPTISVTLKRKTVSTASTQTRQNSTESSLLYSQGTMSDSAITSDKNSLYDTFTREETDYEPLEGILRRNCMDISMYLNNEEDSKLNDDSNNKSEKYLPHMNPKKEDSLLCNCGKDSVLHIEIPNLGSRQVKLPPISRKDNYDH